MYEYRHVISDTVAEWLRRLTRNQLVLCRAGSSPVSVVLHLSYFCIHFQAWVYCMLTNSSTD